jgi:glycerol-3-phosphate O-acyltransferase
MRFVVSERDPGVANWLERTGHRRGYLQIRWQRLTRELKPDDGPAVEIVPVADLAGRLPYYEQAQVSPQQHADRIAARQAAVAVRMLG